MTTHRSVALPAETTDGELWSTIVLLPQHKRWALTASALGQVAMYPMRRPFFFYPKDKAPLALQHLASSIEAADAYVMVTPVRPAAQCVASIGTQTETPRSCLFSALRSSVDRACTAPGKTQEYNHAPAPALLDTLNHFGSSSFAFKPSCIVTYSAGQWGGTRAAVGLRTVLSELGCLPVSAMIHIPHAANLFAPDGSLVDTADEERWECVARIYPIERWISLSLVLSHPIADLAADCQSLRCAELGAAGVVGDCNETTPRQCGSNGPISTFSVRAGSEKCTLTSARGHHQSSLNTPTSLCQPYDCIILSWRQALAQASSS
jgi:NAD(P)H-dependent FMN reductase